MLCIVYVALGRSGGGPNRRECQEICVAMTTKHQSLRAILPLASRHNRRRAASPAKTRHRVSDSVSDCDSVSV